MKVKDEIKSKQTKINIIRIINEIDLHPLQVQ